MKVKQDIHSEIAKYFKVRGWTYATTVIQHNKTGAFYCAKADAWCLFHRERGSPCKHIRSVMRYIDNTDSEVRAYNKWYAAQQQQMEDKNYE